MVGVVLVEIWGGGIVHYGKNHTDDCEDEEGELDGDMEWRLRYAEHDAYTRLGTMVNDSG